MAADMTSEAGVEATDVHDILINADGETECTPVGAGHHSRASIKLSEAPGEPCAPPTDPEAATPIENASVSPFTPPSWQCFRACWGDDATVVGDIRLRLLFQVYCDLASTTRWRNVQVVNRELHTGETIYAIEGDYIRKPKRARGVGHPAGINTESVGPKQTEMGPCGSPQQEVLALVYPLAYDDSLASCRQEHTMMGCEICLHNTWSTHPRPALVSYVHRARLLELLSCVRASAEAPGMLILALCNEQEIVYEELRGGLYAATEEEAKLKKTRARISQATWTGIA